MPRFLLTTEFSAAPPVVVNVTIAGLLMFTLNKVLCCVTAVGTPAVDRRRVNVTARNKDGKRVAFMGGCPDFGWTHRSKGKIEHKNRLKILGGATPW